VVRTSPIIGCTLPQLRHGATLCSAWKARRSPASGGPLKPSTSTGTDGPASSMVAP